MEEYYGIVGLIKGTYPISFIAMVGGAFGAILAYIPRRQRIKSLERQLGIRDAP